MKKEKKLLIMGVCIVLLAVALRSTNANVVTTNSNSLGYDVGAQVNLNNGFAITGNIEAMNVGSSSPGMSIKESTTMQIYVDAEMVMINDGQKLYNNCMVATGGALMIKEIVAVVNNSNWSMPTTTAGTQKELLPTSTNLFGNYTACAEIAGFEILKI